MIRDYEAGPEAGIIYRDEGCDLFPSCLKCPLPRCRHDEEARGRRPSKLLRNERIMMEQASGAKTVAELARTFGVSKRTIQRVIRRSSSEQHL
jgi:hypothetical protein